jgi:hypothetical protein
MAVYSTVRRARTSALSSVAAPDEEERERDKTLLEVCMACLQEGATGVSQEYRSYDVERCISGRCIGKFCPCLCHVESLRLAHYNGQLVRRRGRIADVSPRNKARAKERG